MTSVTFKPGDIVVPPGREPHPALRFIVLEWKPGWISLARATRENRRHKTAIAFSGSDGNWVHESQEPKASK